MIAAPTNAGNGGLQPTIELCYLLFLILINFIPCVLLIYLSYCEIIIFLLIQW